MERLRLLAAAAALRNFTVSELVAYSGTNENTVRTVLQRDRDLFSVVPDDGAHERKGRPFQRFSVKNAELLRAKVNELSGGGDVPTLRDKLTRSLDENRVAALVVGEDAIKRAWDAKTPHERALLAETAMESLSQARVDAGEQLKTGDAITQRAERVSVLAEITQSEARGQSLNWEGLLRGAKAVADLTGVAPLERVKAFLSGLGELAIRSNELPPLQLILTGDDGPSRAMSALAERLEGWIPRALRGTDRTAWSQSWVTPLLDHSLVTGVVVDDRGRDELQLEEDLIHLYRSHVPTVVLSHRKLSHRKTVDAIERVAAAGACFVPVTASGSVKMTVAKALSSTFKSRLNEW